MNEQSPHGLYSLPPEMVYEIVSYLGPTDFVSLLFANYDLLCHHGLAPRLSIDRLATLLAICSLRAHESATPLHRLPTELLIYTMSSMRPLAMVNFVFAHYHHLRLRGIAPPLTVTMSPQFIGARNRAVRGA